MGASSSPVPRSVTHLGGHRAYPPCLCLDKALTRFHSQCKRTESLAILLWTVYSANIADYNVALFFIAHYSMFNQTTPTPFPAELNTTSSRQFCWMEEGRKEMRVYGSCRKRTRRRGLCACSVAVKSIGTLQQMNALK